MPGERRQKGLGSVYPRKDGRWVAALTVDGRPRTRYASTQVAAEAALAQLHQEAAESRLPAKGVGQLTVGRLLTTWLAGKEGTIVPEAYRRHRDAVELRLKPALGTVRVVQLEPDTLRRLYAKWRKEGKLAPSTLRKTHITLKAALAQAVRDGLLTRNVAELVQPPKADTPEQHPLSPAEVRRLMDAAKTMRRGALFVVAVTTGARLGELLGSKWTDFDLAHSRFTIQRTLALDAQKRPHLAERTKRHASRRTVPLPPVAIEALQAHKRQQAEERKRAGAQWQENGLTFATEIGTLVNYSNVENRDWPALKAAAGLPPLTKIHDLRHTAATGWLLAGLPLPEVAQLLGHSSPHVTAQTYSHVLQRHRTDAAKLLADFYARGEAPESDS